jgi:hypothetical protein
MFNLTAVNGRYFAKYYLVTKIVTTGFRNGIYWIRLNIAVDSYIAIP